jgi:hypothetical protein
MFDDHNVSIAEGRGTQKWGCPRAAPSLPPGSGTSLGGEIADATSLEAKHCDDRPETESDPEQIQGNHLM